MCRLVDLLVAKERWNPVVGVSVRFIEFENVSLLKLVDPDGDLFRSDIFIAGEDLHLDAFGSVSLRPISPAKLKRPMKSRRQSRETSQSFSSEYISGLTIR